MKTVPRLPEGYLLYSHSNILMVCILLVMCMFYETDVFFNNQVYCEFYDGSTYLLFDSA